MARFLMIVGLFLFLIGFLLNSKIPLGKLPGDISVHRENFHFFFPLATSIFLSLFLTLLIYLFSKK
ncbi:MAG: DUF2905 domain-containing protein [Candidatus Omnitrophica bacterium]|nr:DUF2905 domain-containing protein [Candidatus Omnitrophota bacterium]